jgi:hypothetical protein
MDGSVHTFCVPRQPKCCWRAFSRPAILTVLVGEHQPGGYLAAAPRQTDVDKVPTTRMKRPLQEIYQESCHRLNQLAGGAIRWNTVRPRIRLDKHLALKFLLITACCPPLPAAIS